MCGAQCPPDEPCITYCCDPNGGCNSDALKSGCTADQFLTEEVCPGGTILSGVVLCSSGACDTNYDWVVAQTGGLAIVNGASGSTFVPGGSCTDVEFDLDVDIDSPAGTATILFTASAEFGGNCLPLSTLSCPISATMTVVAADLEVDSDNHHGAVTNGESMVQWQPCFARLVGLDSSR